MFNLFYPQTGLYGASDLVNSSRIASVSTENATLRRRVDELEGALERQALACQALWELFAERLGVEEKDLLAKMEEVDLRDGVADGRMTPTRSECPACRRAIHPKRRTCLYCGTEVAGAVSPFDGR